jgi:predicted oxidoreductase
VAEAFVTLRDAGAVLHFGVSNFTRAQFELLSSRLAFPLVTNEIQFSALHLDTWHDGTLDFCQQHRIAPMAWGPLGGGRLFRDDDERATRVRLEMQAVGEELLGAGVEQVALAWLLRHPAHIVPILGTGKIERVCSAAQAIDLILTREQYFRIWTACTGERLP